MGRRLLKRLDGRPTALGRHYNTAINKADELCDRVVAAMVPSAYTETQVYGWLFPSDVRELLSNAYRAARPNAKTPLSYEVGTGAILSLQFSVNRLATLAPQPEMRRAVSVYATPLYDTINAI